MKRLIFSLLAVCLLISLAPGAFALGPSDSGTCGEGITWTLEDYTLTISGSGEMEDGCPWEEYESSVEHVVLTGGVTKVGAKAFYGFDSLETVDFGDALVEIGEQAFYGCDDIDYIHLPKSFRIFGAQSFRECTSLKYVYCDGGMPRFNDSCLWTGNYISVFYPTNNPWPYEAVSSLVSNFGGNLGIMMGNFDAGVVTAEIVEEDEDETEETEETEAAEETTEATAALIAEVVTEPETEPTTEPTTEPVTEPTTEPTTEPVTEPTTVPTTQPVETTAETEPLQTTQPEEENVVETLGDNSWIGMVLIVGVLTFLIVGALIFRVASHKGGKYTE